MIYAKTHTTESGTILAMCDSELLGTIVKSGEKEIDLKKYAGFYSGEKVDEETAEKILSENMDFYSANVVGNRSVVIFIKNGIVKKENVMKIGSVPYAQIYRVKQ